MVRTRLVHIFREFPVLDPELPEELAALGYARRRAVEIFHTLYEGLAEPSQRHFEAVAQRRERQLQIGSYAEIWSAS